MVKVGIIFHVMIDTNVYVILSQCLLMGYGQSG